MGVIMTFCTFLLMLRLIVGLDILTDSTGLNTLNLQTELIALLVCPPVLLD